MCLYATNSRAALYSTNYARSASDSANAIRVKMLSHDSEKISHYFFLSYSIFTGVFLSLFFTLQLINWDMVANLLCSKGCARRYFPLSDFFALSFSLCWGRCKSEREICTEPMKKGKFRPLSLSHLYFETWKEKIDSNIYGTIEGWYMECLWLHMPFLYAFILGQHFNISLFFPPNIYVILSMLVIGKSNKRDTGQEKNTREKLDL